MKKYLFPCIAALIVSILSACTTKPANPQGSQAGDSSGMTVFGTVDAGVGRVK